MDIKLNSFQLQSSSYASMTSTDVKVDELEKKPELLQKPVPKYTYEDAVMDLEAIKRYLYMLAGMEYTPRNEFGYEKRGEIWA